MNPNPFLGVLLHWLGGLASGSFYVPYRGVKKWSWETYWLVGGFFAWMHLPVGVCGFHDDRFDRRAKTANREHDLVDLFFRNAVGFGGLTFGLTMRYLGMSLGMGVALGYCAAFGTLCRRFSKR